MFTKSSVRLGGRFFVFLFLCISFSPVLHAQYYRTGVDSKSIDWRTIQTTKFKLVYPKEYERTAQRFANLLDTLQPHVGNSLLTPAPRVPFLFHTRSNYSNGLSVWAPKRIELWTTPPQNGYSYPWLWQLAIHEWRHAVQVESMNVGATFFLQKAFGEHIMGLMIALFVPTWFLEGDAVAAETTLAPVGRGAIPAFSQNFRAQLVEKGAYSFTKANLGSYKDHVPNHYVLGYHLVTHGRIIGKKHLWGRVMNNVGNNFWQLFPFNIGLKKHSGMGLSQLYTHMTDSLSHLFLAEDSLFHPDVHATRFSPKNPRYTSYLSPSFITPRQVVALKTSYDSPPLFTLMDSVQEKTLIPSGMVLNEYFHAHPSGKIIWSELQTHARWQHERYAELVEYDLHSGTITPLTRHARLVSPGYHPIHPHQVTAIAEDSINQQHIVIFDKNHGGVVQQIGDTLPDIAFSYPVWDDTGDNIYALKTSPQGKNIVMWNTKQNTLSNITTPDHYSVSRLRCENGYLYFVADYEHKNAIYRRSLRNPQQALERVVMPRFGIGSFHIEKELLVYSDYTADGYRLLQTTIRPENMQRINIASELKDSVVAKLTHEENFLLTEDKLNHRHYESVPYLKFPHLLHIHSWLYPISLDAINRTLSPGISLYSQNLLGTSVFQGGWRYNTTERRSGFFANYSYTGFFPALSINSSYSYRKLIDNPKRSNEFREYLEWEEFILNGNITLPLYWTHRNTQKNFIFSAGTNYRHLYDRNNTSLPINTVVSLSGNIHFSSLENKALKALLPRWGQSVAMSYQVALSELHPDIFSLNFAGYFPGLGRHHSLKIAAGYQKNSPDVYYYPNQIAFPHGIFNYAPETLISIKSSYYFPLSYPDWNIISLFYLKRIYLGGFYDFGIFDGVFMDSFGGEMQADGHVLGMEFPLRLGMRISYNLHLSKYFFEFLYELNL